MNQSAQTIIKTIVAILWLIIDFLLYVVGLFNDFGNFKAVFAIIYSLDCNFMDNFNSIQLDISELN